MIGIGRADWPIRCARVVFGKNGDELVPVHTRADQHLILSEVASLSVVQIIILHVVLASTSD